MSTEIIVAIVGGIIIAILLGFLLWNNQNWLKNRFVKKAIASESSPTTFTPTPGENAFDEPQ